MRNKNGKFTLIDYIGDEINNNWIILERHYEKGRAARYLAKCKYCNHTIIRTMYSLKHSICDCQKEDLAQSRIGTIVGCYKIIDAIKEKNKNTKYVCECVGCGKQHTYSWDGLQEKPDKCYHVNKYGVPRQPMYKWKSRRLGCIYRGIIRRCKDVNDTAYYRYGGKGVKVYKEWIENPMAFQEWAFSHGYEENLTIDRIDANGDYCPENCRWITLSENTIRACSNYITVNGETLNQKEWCEKLNVSKGKIGYIKRKYGNDAVIKFIKDMIENGYSDLENKTKVYIEVNGIRKTQSEWNKILGLGKDTVGTYMRSHTKEETVEYIRRKLKNINKG